MWYFAEMLLATTHNPEKIIAAQRAEKTPRKTWEIGI